MQCNAWHKTNSTISICTIITWIFESLTFPCYKHTRSINMKSITQWYFIGLYTKRSKTTTTSTALIMFQMKYHKNVIMNFTSNINICSKTSIYMFIYSRFCVRFRSDMPMTIIMNGSMSVRMGQLRNFVKNSQSTSKFPWSLVFYNTKIQQELVSQRIRRVSRN